MRLLMDEHTMDCYRYIQSDMNILRSTKRVKQAKKGFITVTGDQHT